MFVPSVVILQGALNLAVVPVPFENPDDPGFPASVVTAPERFREEP